MNRQNNKMRELQSRFKESIIKESKYLANNYNIKFERVKKLLLSPMEKSEQNLSDPMKVMSIILNVVTLKKNIEDDLPPKN